MASGFKVEGAKGTRDKNMISSWSVPYHAETRAECYKVGDKTFMGMPEIGRDIQAQNMGSDGAPFVVTVQYQGYSNEDGGSPETEKDTENWSCDFDFSEEPLQSHPNWENIKKTYGGVVDDQGDVTFPPKLPNGSSAAKSGLGAANIITSSDRNPLYGQKTYLKLRARVSRSWSSRTLPKELLLNVGRIVNEIPDAPTALTELDIGGRDWLSTPPKIKQNGDVWGLTQEWLLSDFGGWPEEVYDFMQI